MGIETVITELTSFLGQRLSRSKSDLELHGQSETHFPLMPPDAVAYPENTQEVAAIVRSCAENKVPVIGWGVGTSLEGQAQAPSGGICVDFTRMNRIREIRQADMDVTIEPGVTREALNEELRATGLFFPIDPGANATLGGMASTRASGTTTVRYGGMRQNVLALEVVTASGEIIRTGSRARKTSSGYDLTGLFIGAEGTLGLITELTLRLQGQPEAVASAVCAFPSIKNAVAAVIDTIQMGIPMARIELVDVASVRAVNAYSGSDLSEAPHLLLEFHGSETGVAEQSQSFGEIAESHGGAGFEWATKAEDRNALWAMRHNAYHAMKATRPGAKVLVTDVCVPISKLADVIEETLRDIENAGIYAPLVGHVGDGNFHTSMMWEEGDADELAAIEAASHRMVERALANGGTATGEHGVGLGKKRYMDREHGPAWAVMGSVKQALDPDNIMNPGKLVPPRN